MAIKLIDVSYWQQGIVWAKVRAAGIGGVLIKSSESHGRIEPMALSQSQGAQGIGLPVGYYHFAHPEADSGSQEATFFAAAIGNLPKADFVPTLDIEINKSNLSPAQMQAWISDFVDTMANLGYPQVMIYSYQPFLDSYLPKDHPFGDLPLWLADYRSTPHIPHGWTTCAVWQYSGSGTLDGVNGKVDLNTCTDLPLSQTA